MISGLVYIDTTQELAVTRAHSSLLLKAIYLKGVEVSVPGLSLIDQNQGLDSLSESSDYKTCSIYTVCRLDLLVRGLAGLIFINPKGNVAMP